MGGNIKISVRVSLSVLRYWKWGSTVLAEGLETNTGNVGSWQWVVGVGGAFCGYPYSHFRRINKGLLTEVGCGSSIRAEEWAECASNALRMGRWNPRDLHGSGMRKERQSKDGAEEGRTSERQERRQVRSRSKV